VLAFRSGAELAGVVDVAALDPHAVAVNAVAVRRAARERDERGETVWVVITIKSLAPSGRTARVIH
jgi:hypothetical protein